MNKEMFISSSPHETKVAVCEDGQLVEVYFERDTDVGLVGGIYKGRVNRVLPGMQSAFVDIGLERDAFLYVSDFSLQDQDEFEGVLDESQKRGATLEVETQPSPGTAATTTESGAGPAQPEGVDEAEAGAQPVEAGETQATEGAVTTAAETPAQESAASAEPAQAPAEETGFRRRSRRGRRHHRHGRGGSGDRRHSHRPEPQVAPPKPEPVEAAPSSFEILPGESLAKYSHSETEEPLATEASSSTAVENSPSEATTGPEATAKLEAPKHEVESSGDLPTEEAKPEEKGPRTRAESPVESDEEESASGFRQPLAQAPEPDSPASETPVETSAEAAESQESESPKVEEASARRQDSKSGNEERSKQGDDSSSGESDAERQPEAASGPEENPESGETSEGGDVPAAVSAEAEESGDRSATLREPHARPRFAPRRGRRGRRRTSRHTRRHVSRESTRAGSQQGLQISEMLKEGQEIIVQIAKEPLGTKGARITSHVALPGRYVVYMPTISHIGVSRKIASEQERLRLRNIIVENKGSLTGGFIVRTAGEGRSEEEIKADLKFLTALWNEIRTRAEQVKAPARLYRDLDLAQRLMRDLVTPDFKSIWLDNESDYEKVVEFMSQLQPASVGSVKLHTRSTSLFEEHGIQEEIEKALRPKVWLKSGGYIVINQTEALVAIDVNTGKYVGKTNRLEDTIVKINIDAVNEIVRQVRLRDLGGIIVVDFIDMDERRNRNKVIQALEEALRHDRAPTKVLSFNDFGLVAVTRKRVKQSLERTLCDPCTYCNGSGWVKSVSTVCYEILAEARKMADEIEGKTMTLRVNPEVALELKSKDGTLVAEIEALTHKNLVIKTDPTIHQERFEIF